MKDRATLNGIKIGCFFPWQTLLASGARTRFSTLWRYLIGEGAHVTLGLLQHCKFRHYENLSIREYSGARRYELSETIDNYHSRLLLQPEFAGISRDGALFIHLFSSENYRECPGFEEWARGIIREVDVVSIDYPMMVPFLAPLCRELNKPILLTAHDALHKLHGNTPETRRLIKQREEEAFAMVDSLFFVAEEDRNEFGAVHPHSHVVVNTGDAHAVQGALSPQDLRRVEELYGVGHRPFVLFVGSKHPPNIEAAHQLQQMSPQVGEIDFVVAGACCGKDDRGNFKSLGVVNDVTLKVLYHQADAVVIPLTSGSGSSLKFYEAMAYGKPVVSTSIGARGHDVRDGCELIVENSLERFPVRIRELRNNAAQMRTLSAAARLYAESRDFRKTFSPYAPEILRLVAKTGSLPVRKARLKKRPKLIMVDPGLRDDIGHYLPYAVSLKKAAEEFGLEFTTLVHRDATAEVCAAVQGIPCFRYGVHDIAYDSGLIDLGSAADNYRYGVIKTNEVFATDLWKGLEGVVGFDDHLYFPNITERQFLGLVSAISFTALGHYPQCHAMLRYPLCLPTLTQGGLGERRVTARHDELVALYKIGFDALQTAKNNSALRLVTDSAALAREYRSILDCSVDVIPIPHTHPEGLRDEAFERSLPVKRRGEIRVVYLGDARDEKGFSMLPFAAMALTDRFGAHKVQFVFQALVSSSHHAGMSSAITDLEAMRLSNVHLIKRPLTVAEYHTLLESADLVLLPYDGLVYRSRTSGPFVEALCAGKPVVAPGQTWMAEELSGSRAGCLFQERTDAELYSACVSAIEDLSKNSRAAQEFGTVYKRYHNPRSFIERLLTSYAPRISDSTQSRPQRGRLHPVIELIGESLTQGYDRPPASLFDDIWAKP